jgi:hypothetical protein
MCVWIVEELCLAQINSYAKERMREEMMLCGEW